MNIARVFPRRTKATPDDVLSFHGVPTEPDLMRAIAEGAEAIHIDVTFSQDKPIAERLAELWHHAAIAPVTIGGVQYETEKDPYPLEFVPGRYIKHGYTFTSRGCPRRCWFCSVWKRRPEATPIPNYPDGWNVLDDNLLSCPEPHVRAVFAMLKRQKRRIEFTGGLEAAALQDYQVDLLASLHPKPAMFWAYDPGDPFETLALAAKRMLESGFTRASHRLRTYVLIGYPKDTFAEAEIRLRQMLSIGFTPMAMLWQPETPAAEKWRPAPEWRRFQRSWVRPKMIHSKPSSVRLHASMHDGLSGRSGHSS